MTKRTWTVSAAEAGQTLDKFLAAADRLGSRSKAAAARERGKVFVNGSEAGPADVRRRLDARRRNTSLGRPAGQLAAAAGAVQVRAAAYPLRGPAPDRPEQTRRPAGGSAGAEGEETSIFDQIEDHFRSHGKRKPFVVHRIDRDTSGIVLFAKDGRTHAALKHQFRERTPERVYLAVVYGHPTPDSGTWRDHLVWDGKALIQKETHPKDPRAAEAISHYTVVETI